MDSSSVRQVYLITYSHANLVNFPTRRSFAEAVQLSFGRDNILQWVCCRENHTTSEVAQHYHMAVKLTHCMRWLASKRFLQERHGISVHFSASHSNYYTAWQYVNKEDAQVLQSESHPDLWNQGPPRTIAASAQRMRQRATSLGSQNDSGHVEGTKRPKRKRISAYEVSQIILERGIKTRTELLALANRQQSEGKNDIAEFIVNRGKKVVAEVLTTTWEMKDAEEKLERQQQSRTQLLEKTADEQCTVECNGMWYTLATQILERNNVPVSSFASSVLNLLEKGRGKYRNIMICGPANCGKTFLLNPLNIIYKTFTNPAATSFAWVGAEEAEIIFLNDFRWNAQIITWSDLLLLLEGQLVHLPAPKTHFAKDIEFKNDTPIFCTSKRPLVYVKNGIIEERETEMMAVRWNIYHFNRQFTAEEQIELSPCGPCFARLIMQNGVTLVGN